MRKRVSETTDPREGPSPVTPPEEDPEVKKAKEQQASFRLIKANLVAARDEGKWVGAANSFVQDSVCHWTLVACGALDELAADNEGGQSHAEHAANFTVIFEQWLVKLVWHADCYPQWQEFAGLP